MDMETIRKINRSALRAARESLNSSNMNMKNDMDMNNVLIALVSGAVIYWLLTTYKPQFVMTKSMDNQQHVDNMRLWFITAVAALVVYYILAQQH